MKKILVSLTLLIFFAIDIWAASYSTSFPATENPISEGGNWINGAVTGLDWHNVRTTTNLVFGTQNAGNANFDDSEAVLTGSWGANQTVTATAYSVNQTDSVIEEIELHTRTIITAHSITGYEFNYRCLPGSDGLRYVQIVRLDGATSLGQYLLLDSQAGPGINTGDIVKAVSNGSTHSTYVNNNLVFSVTDSTYTNGSPGVGFYLDLAPNTSYNADFGFTSFTATDGIVSTSYHGGKKVKRIK